MDEQKRDDRWQNLVSRAFLLEEQLQGGEGSARPSGLKAAVDYLESTLDVFPSSVDPVEDFEGYAVRRMVQGLLAALRADAPR
ncbi:hypothetical protein [Hyalangium rubrum]|uniref:Uncharacterized protein n=1 Tax=Hyalangium rubrum TaxID=3103134 RepID=A0ABU5HED7_9BACT|nr:hypothetical protein [Hyalangium sp. s54d21]MDY7231827.1 hypothetical protein [Hyalangium sp. s54d21]